MLGPDVDGSLDDSTAHLFDGWWSRAVSGHGVVVPDGAVDLIWVAGRTPWIAGPDTGPRTVELETGDIVVAVRLKPGLAHSLLGIGVDQVTDQVVPLSEVQPAAAVDRLNEVLAQTRNPRQAAAAMADAITDSVPEGWHPDAIVIDALERLRGGMPVEHGPLSERQFRRRFTRAVGYGPTFFRRIARLDAYTALADRHPTRSIAELAATVGYYDEAHLWRDATDLTGDTPSRLRPER